MKTWRGWRAAWPTGVWASAGVAMLAWPAAPTAAGASVVVEAPVSAETSVVLAGPVLSHSSVKSRAAVLPHASVLHHVSVLSHVSVRHQRVASGDQSVASPDHRAVSPDAPVADAARRGDAMAVRELLAEGADPNSAHGDGMTGLHWAAFNGDPEVAGLLVASGAALEARTRLGAHRPLHVAAREGHGEVVALLLKAGADVAALTTTGAAPLHFAAASGDLPSVSVLLDHGAAVDVQEPEWGQTPLHFAAARGRTAAVEALLAAGADPLVAARVLDLVDRDIADRASERRRRAEVAATRARAMTGEPVVAEGQAADDKSPASASAAVRETEAREAQAREAQGREVQVREVQRQAQAQETQAREAPAREVQARQVPGRDAQARQAQAREAAQEALEIRQRTGEPVPLNFAGLVATHGGLSAVHLAAREGHAETVVALLEGGVPIDFPSAADGATPMLIAAINGYFDLAAALLRRGADPNLASDAGAAPLYAVLNMQWAPKARHPQPLVYQQQEIGYLELMRELLDAGADVDARLRRTLWYTTYNRDLLGVDRTGATPFWRAAHATDVPAMKLLLEYGADPNLPTIKVPQRRFGPRDETDHSGLPPVPVGGPAVYPIHAAAGVGYGQGFAGNSHRHVPDGWMPAVRFLVEELGADVNARDHNGYTPVHHAAARGDNEMILYLVEKGADVTAVARSGQTTVDLANGPVQRIQPFPATVALLERLGAKNNHRCVSC